MSDNTKVLFCIISLIVAAVLCISILSTSGCRDNSQEELDAHHTAIVETQTLLFDAQALIDSAQVRLDSITPKEQ